MTSYINSSNMIRWNMLIPMSLLLQTVLTFRQSVLMLIVDDLRSSMIDPATEANMIKLPNIDRLAARGVRFNNAFAQYSMCSPSRSSLLTGTRPDTTHVFDLTTHFRSNIPTVATLPQAFRNQGYISYGVGKVFHRGFGDDFYSFTSPQPLVDKPAYCTQINQQIDTQRKESSHRNGIMHGGKVQRGPAVEKSYSNCSFHDSTTADVAIQILQKVAEDALFAGGFTRTGNPLKANPFFLAVGFIRPHLPWVAPVQYWDQHVGSAFDHIDDPYKVRSKRLPSFILGGSHELASYYGVDIESLTSGATADSFSASELRHAYAASASYSDAQVGRVLEELSRLKLDTVTHVVLWSDHGYKLGEHGGSWGKNSNTMLDTRVPLVVAVATDTEQGWETDALVELVDVYPTLLDLCNLNVPTRSHPMEGDSFKDLLLNKSLAQSIHSSSSSSSSTELFPEVHWKKAIFTQVARKHLLTGYSMFTSRYRFTVWVDTRSIFEERAEKQPFNANGSWSQDHNKDLMEASNRRELIEKNKLDKKKTKFIELYDVLLDPYELNNLGSNREHGLIRQGLASLWEKGFCGARATKSLNGGAYTTGLC